MKKTRILVVDDELSIIKFLRANLQASGYEMLAAMDGAEALKTVERELPDLVILDIKMPKVDGFEVCRQIRKWCQVPIIMLSIIGDEMDKVKCLDLGADDYITKPFGATELMARVRALLRRTETVRTTPTQPSLTFGDLEINFMERRLTVAGREVKLTPTEYSLLQELALNPNKAFTHEMLLQKIWGPEYGDEREYLHVFIGRLRKQIEPNPENPSYIITIPAVGYKFKTAR